MSSNFHNTALRRADDAVWDAAWHRTMRKAFVTQACQLCGHTFTYIPQPQQRRKYCSDDCRGRNHMLAERKRRAGRRAA